MSVYAVLLELYSFTALPPPFPFISVQVLILRELAVHTPTLFYQQIQQFFDNIFIAVRDPKVRTALLPVMQSLVAWTFLVLKVFVGE